VRAAVRAQADPVLAPLLAGRCAALVPAAAALLGELALDAGAGAADPSAAVAALLGCAATAHAGLCLAAELLLNRCPLDPAVLRLIAPLLPSACGPAALRVAREFARACPSAVTELILLPLVPHLGSVPTRVLDGFLGVADVALAADPDPAVAAAVAGLVGHPKAAVAVFAAHIFAEHSHIPFMAELPARLYLQLSADDEVLGSGASHQAAETLAAIVERYPRESMAVLLPEIERSLEAPSVEALRRAVRCLSVAREYLGGADAHVGWLLGLLDSPVRRDAAACLTALSPSEATAAILLEMVGDADGATRMQALRCFLDLFSRVEVQAQPFAAVFPAAFAQLPPDEHVLLMEVIVAFCQSVKTLAGDDCRALLTVLCEAFLGAGPTDPLLIGALDGLTAALPKIASASDEVISAVGGKVMDGLRQTDDSEFAASAFSFVSSVAVVIPEHAIVVAAAECVGIHIRVDQNANLMIECWRFLSHLVRNVPGTIAAIAPVALAFVLSLEEQLDPSILSNIAFVLFDLLKEVRIGTDEAQRIFDLMARALGEADEAGDGENIGCCIARVLAANPKVQCPEAVLATLFRYFAAIPNDVLVRELQCLIGAYVAHWPDLAV
jgi:hypothetical protein